MRILGVDRTEIELDPTAAFRRGRKLDAMFAAANVPRPRGVTRATHARFAQLDDARMVATAKRLGAR